MINRSSLLSDLQSVLRQLETDLIQRCSSPDVPEVGAWLQAEFAKASEAKRTAQNYTDWLNDYATQVAAAWVLSCVFARFLEDNALYEPPMIAGSANHLQRAKDERELYFREHPGLTDRDYLLHVFQTLRDLRGGVVKEVFGGHNPVNELPNWLGPDAAGILLRFFQQIEPNTGDIRHDFTDPNWDTRFLGDLYQDLSEAARKKYALLQTPEFVEEFILDRTLDPALDEFGLTPGETPDASAPSENRKPKTENLFKLIDPACGSGHFLLGTFPRILNRWQRQEPGTNVRELVQRTLDSIHGVDINPFAIAIARFRLLLAAMRACNITRLIDAPAFRLNLVCGDSLLHVPLKSGGSKFTKGQREFDAMVTDSDGEVDHAYLSEDLPELKRILKPNQYHAVVANPPYIVPKDRALNEQYRNRFESCHMKYSLSVPFLERIFRLAVAGGYTGQITANSFMKREFGKKLIESFIPSVDLTHVIDTSGAYIPGHGTPTVILFGRHRPPLGSTLRTVMGIRGEPATPADPARGLVWSAIVAQWDQPGSQSKFVSVGDSPRDLFHKHPWSIGGGGAAELKEQLEDTAPAVLKAVIDEIGVFGITAADDVMYAPADAFRRFRVAHESHRRLVLGDEVRDWSVSAGDDVLFPYANERLVQLEMQGGHYRWLWPNRTALWARVTFSRQTYREEGRTWWEWHQTTLHRLRTPLTIVFGAVATHNHFVLDRDGKVFKQSAPIIKLPKGATDADHRTIVGILNSSLTCFWMKQVMFAKSGQRAVGVHRDRPEEVHFDFNATALLQLPIPDVTDCAMVRRIAFELDSLAAKLNCARPESIIDCIKSFSDNSLRLALSDGYAVHTETHLRMIALQEELDWELYRVFGLCEEGASQEILDDESHGVLADSRPFLWESDATPDCVPPTWRKRYRTRRGLLRSKPELGLIETPMYKRPWWGRQGVYGRLARDYDGWTTGALAKWLLSRLEAYFDFDGRMKEVASRQLVVASDDKEEQTERGKRMAGSPPLAAIQLCSIAKLADVASKDADFMQVAELYRDDPAFNVMALVEELVAAETVPLLPVLRYKDTGLRKRADWEKTWELQRREDAASDQLAVVSRQLEKATAPEERHRLQAEHEKLATENSKLTTSIPVPPKYDSKDFLNANFWRLRGKLDVPKERWISFPGAEAEDGSLMIAWAGYDHLQQAQAISAWYVEIRDQQGGHNDKRLIPLLACLLELQPWIKQWHNSSDNEFNMSMADFFEGFIKEEARQLPRPATEPTEPDGEDLFPDAAAAITYGWSLPEIQAWKPSARRTAKRASKKAAKKAAAPKKAAKKRGKKSEDG